MKHWDLLRALYYSPSAVRYIILGLCSVCVQLYLQLVQREPCFLERIGCTDAFRDVMHPKRRVKWQLLSSC